MDFSEVPAPVVRPLGVDMPDNQGFPSGAPDCPPPPEAGPANAVTGGPVSAAGAAATQTFPFPSRLTHGIIEIFAMQHLS